MVIDLTELLKVLTYTNISKWTTKYSIPTQGTEMMRVHFEGVIEKFESKHLVLIQ